MPKNHLLLPVFLSFVLFMAGCKKEDHLTARGKCGESISIHCPVRFAGEAENDRWTDGPKPFDLGTHGSCILGDTAYELIFAETRSVSSTVGSPRQIFSAQARFQNLSDADQQLELFVALEAPADGTAVSAEALERMLSREGLEGNKTELSVSLRWHTSGAVTASAEQTFDLHPEHDDSANIHASLVLAETYDLDGQVFRRVIIRLHGPLFGTVVNSPRPSFLWSMQSSALAMHFRLSATDNAKEWH